MPLRCGSKISRFSRSATLTLALEAALLRCSDVWGNVCCDRLTHCLHTLEVHSQLQKLWGIAVIKEFADLNVRLYFYWGIILQWAQLGTSIGRRCCWRLQRRHITFSCTACEAMRRWWRCLCCKRGVSFYRPVASIVQALVEVMTKWSWCWGFLNHIARCSRQNVICIVGGLVELNLGCVLVTIDGKVMIQRRGQLWRFVVGLCFVVGFCLNS